MNAPLARLDRWLIERAFEPAAWWCERRFDISAIQLALPLMMVWLAASLAMVIIQPSWWRGVYAAGALVIVPARVWGLARRIHRHGTANTEKHGAIDILFRVLLFWAMTVFWLLVAVVALLGETMPVTAMDVGTTCFTAHLFFAACDAPPPQEQRQPAHAVPEAV